MWEMLLNFKTIFLGVLLGALPFLLFSVIVSSILHNIISEDVIQRLLPRNKTYSLLLASSLGIIFPSCDCGMVPIGRRLMHKGVPVYSAIAFMLATPIINPMVIFSTFYAFNSWDMVLSRLGIAFFVAFCTGWLSSVLFKKIELKEDVLVHKHGCACCHSHEAGQSTVEKLLAVLDDARSEFFDMGKYLLCGSLLGAAAQTFVPRTALLNIGHEPFISLLVMMAFAFLISVCSSADAFIAASFLSSFSTEALVAFMVFGPMFDVKNTLMLLHTFRSRFVAFLFAAVALLCIVGCYLFTYNVK